MKNCYSSLVMFVVLGFCAVASYAEEQYQAEISVGSNRSDYDQDVRAITDTFSAEIFFAPVKTAERPYAAAAFLERNGSVKLSIGDSGVNSGTGEGSGPRLFAGVNYARPDFPLAIQATYSKSKFEYGAPINMTSNSNAYSISIGNYFTRALLAGIGYANSKSDASRPGMPTLTFKNTDYSLFARYINELEHGTALDLAGSLSSSTSDDGTSKLRNIIEQFSVEYFFNRGLSAGIGIENRSGENLGSEGRTYSADVRYFASPRFSVIAMYGRFLNANAGYTSDKHFGVTMALRI